MASYAAEPLLVSQMQLLNTHFGHVVEFGQDAPDVSVLLFLEIEVRVVQLDVIFDFPDVFQALFILPLEIQSLEAVHDGLSAVFRLLRDGKVRAVDFVLEQILHVLRDKGVVLHEGPRRPEGVSLGKILLFGLTFADPREAAGLLDDGLAVVVEHLLGHLDVDF